jgi:hypothetical protein
VYGEYVLRRTGRAASRPTTRAIATFIVAGSRERDRTVGNSRRLVA